MSRQHTTISSIHKYKCGTWRETRDKEKFWKNYSIPRHTYQREKLQDVSPTHAMTTPPPPAPNPIASDFHHLDSQQREPPPRERAS